MYPADILNDTALNKCSPEARCAWYESLFRMWLENTCELTGTPEEFHWLWRIPEGRISDIIEELKEKEVCTVTFCHKKVTLTSRRLQRQQKDRDRAAKRKREQRARESCHGPVPSEKGFLSSSSSFSLSKSHSPTSADAGGKKPENPEGKTGPSAAEKRKAKREHAKRLYRPLTERLHEIIETQRAVVTGYQPHRWDDAFRLLVEKDGASMERVKAALEGYAGIVGETMAPDIWSAAAFRAKFAKLERNLERRRHETPRSEQEMGFWGGER